MNTNLEIEYKVLLNKDAFDALVNAYPDARTYTQTNHYFTSPVLKDKRMALRIREKNGAYEMTVKTAKVNGGRMEYNLDITKDTMDLAMNGPFPDNDITAFLKSEGVIIKDITPLASLTTIRHDVILDHGTLSIDESFYEGAHDYEVEFEISDDQGPKQWADLCATHHIDATKEAPTKLARAINAMNNHD